MKPMKSIKKGQFCISLVSKVWYSGNYDILENMYYSPEKATYGDFVEFMLNESNVI